VEFTDDFAAPRWNTLPAVTGNGLEQTITQPMGGRRFFRVKRE
jgi:hypothetical protein